ncbi:MAG: type II secretion system GspH family protein [Candidatus Omnitrophica bacterium]|jgi:prepilin-type N-terminal cleavage/methylation domain-containing protein|nr:type II secretion system GspH family protein [Candidatus Omnitrophota bacterium]
MNNQKERFFLKRHAQLERNFLTGFTLVEIMVAVSIVLILAVLVIPNVLRARINSNEVSTISNLSSLGKSIQQYSMTNDYKYPQAFEDLVAPNSNPPYIDRDFIDNAKSGYLYVYEYQDDDNFRLLASPKTPGRTGVRYFYLDETGIIRAKEGGQASESDPPVQ